MFDSSERKVYVLGAGASEGAGLPLMSNFLNNAEELREKHKEYLFSWEDVPGKDCERFVTFLTRYSGNSWVKSSKIEKIDDNTIKVSAKKNHLLLKLNDEKVEINLKNGRIDKLIAKKENDKLNIYRIRLFDDVWEYLDAHNLKKHFNIEEILGNLDMEISINDSNSDKESRIKDRLLEFIEDVIVLSYFYGDKKKVSEYSILLKKFVENLGENDAIISFNYDVLIDKILTDNKKCPDYGIDLDGYQKPNKFDKLIPLLKLHGSLNWRICPKCKKPRWIGYKHLLEMAGDDEISNKVHELFFKFLTACPMHKRLTIEETFFIPPSWNKNDYFYNKDLWKSASEKLKNADKIIFIGYSLPQTDIYFKYLLSSFARNASVEVVDPNIENVAGRYLEIFKDKISFKAKRFEDYIKDCINHNSVLEV